VQNQQVVEIYQTGAGVSVLTDEKGALLKELYALPGREMLDRILDVDEPKALIQEIPCEDFFWLVKKVGEDDSLALLELASVDQWQYLLDLETWVKDRVDISHTAHWLNLLQKANCGQLAKWLLDEDEYLASYHFFRTLEVVVINNTDEIYGLPAGFFSLDDALHIRVNDPRYRRSIENIIRVMANEDFDRCQTLLLGLGGRLPAEVEEEMYRLRNVRLAEHGFLPFEEAIAVYSPLDPAVLEGEDRQDFPEVIDDAEIRALAPVLPLAQTEAENLFMEGVASIRDPLLLNRLRLEFAGLANQIISADGLIVRDNEVLSQACRKVARIVNLSIERVCSLDVPSAEDLLRRHSLVTLFRVGFGMVLKLKWEAERWLKESWFYGQGLDTGFWGEHWGGILNGLLAKRPRYYVGSREREECRDFEWLSELDECLDVLRSLMLLDGLLEKLIDFYQIREMRILPETTYRSHLFNLWCRLILKIEPSFSGISLEQAKNLFSQLRDASSRPPYCMPDFKQIFIRDLMAHAPSSYSETASILENNLSQIWEEFHEEYERVSVNDLNGKCSRFVTIEEAH